MSSETRMGQTCLAIEATNRWLVAGLVRGAPDALDCAFRMEAPRESFRRLIPGIQDLLARSNISSPDWIAAARGPGSFTGTRISVSAARNLAQLWDVPVRSVASPALYLYSCALAARKAGAEPDTTIAIMIDGKQERVFAVHSTIESALSGEVVARIKSGAPGSAPLEDSAADLTAGVIVDIAPDPFLARLCEAAPDALVYVDDSESVRGYMREPRALEISHRNWRTMQAPSANELRDLCLTPGVSEIAWAELVPDYLREDPATSKFQKTDRAK